MAGLSSKTKKRRGEYEQKTRELQASIQKQKQQVSQTQNIANIVSNYQQSKAKGTSFRAGYYPKNPNYEPGFRIPQVGTKEG